MPRLSIKDIPQPADEYRLDRALPCIRTGKRFETKAEARAEDRTRARLLRRASRSNDIPFDREAALELADRLEESGQGAADHQTMASKLYMGGMRHKIGSALWRLVDARDAKTFTITPSHWIVDADKLAEIDPRRLLAAIKSILNRQSARTTGGWLIAAIHGEFDPVAKQFHLHIHGVATGGKITVVRNLRKLPKYRFRRSRGDKRRKVTVGRKQITNLPYPLIYIFQSSWPSRWRGVVDGKEKKSSKRNRISEPHHSQLLLWLDRWELKDITLLMGVSVGQNGLIISR